MSTDDKLTVPFYCPICNGDKAELLMGAVMADPHSPVLKCVDCGTQVERK